MKKSYKFSVIINNWIELNIFLLYKKIKEIGCKLLQLKQTLPKAIEYESEQ